MGQLVGNKEGFQIDDMVPGTMSPHGHRDQPNGLPHSSRPSKAGTSFNDSAWKTLCPAP